jgi:hypothetical protein
MFSFDSRISLANRWSPQLFVKELRRTCTLLRSPEKELSVEPSARVYQQLHLGRTKTLLLPAFSQLLE